MTFKPGNIDLEAPIYPAESGSALAIMNQRVSFPLMSSNQCGDSEKKAEVRLERIGMAMYEHAKGVMERAAKRKVQEQHRYNRPGAVSDYLLAFRVFE